MHQQKLLAGVRVVDLSQYIPGPFATRQLADLGADVIKIEPPGGDPMRRFMAPGDDEASPVYRHVNRGKRVCRLDLKLEQDRAVFAALLRDADILLESFRPGVLTRLGFARDRLDEINPRLIHCALSGYGQQGPWAQRAGHDINYCALAGQSIVSGTAERPVIAYPPIADHAGAMQAAVAMLAALHGRENRNGGIFLDISITESILAWQYLPLLGGESGRAASILDGGAACYNIYRCADGHFISIGAIEVHFWENFCNALQRPEWIPRQHEEMPQTSLIEEVGEQIGRFDADHWHRLLDSVDCCYAPLLAPQALTGHPYIQTTGFRPVAGPGYAGRINDVSVTTDESFVDIPDSESPPAWI
jgi:crotonobetainyl-CoA:carnitine CoA-transferase CaiB-like acyl-CoA transferase